MGARKYRPRSTPEQRAAAVELYRSSGRSAQAVADELGMPSATLEAWIRREGRREIDPEGTMPEAQLREIQRLQRENARLQREVEFLKKADAFFRELDQRKRDSR